MRMQFTVGNYQVQGHLGVLRYTPLKHFRHAPRDPAVVRTPWQKIRLFEITHRNAAYTELAITHAPGNSTQSASQEPGTANAWAERAFREGDLAYGLEKTSPIDAGRGWYIRYGPFRLRTNHPVAQRADDYRVLAGEKNKAALAPDEAQFRRALQRMPKYRSALDAPESNEAVRRKVKGALEWAIRDAGKHIHFVLDGLDMREVVEKSHGGRNADVPIGSSRGRSLMSIFTGTKQRAYTGSELRWIYRNRNDPLVQQHVHFYLGGEHVPAPWERGSKLDPQTFAVVEDPQGGPKLWRRYLPHAEWQGND